MVRPRVRIRFSKQSTLRLIGHRDLMRSLERLFRRAGLSLGMSEGYRPKPRMNFPLALAVGIEGRREVMELEVNEAPPADELLARLRAQAPPGLRIESLEVLPPGCLLEISYESVVADLETAARRLVGFCGLAWDPLCLAFHQTRRPVFTSSAAQVRRPISDAGVQRWRRYEAHLGPLFEALGPYAPL